MDGNQSPAKPAAHVSDRRARNPHQFRDLFGHPALIQRSRSVFRQRMDLPTVIGAGISPSRRIRQTVRSDRFNRAATAATGSRAGTMGVVCLAMPGSIPHSLSKCNHYLF